MIKMLNKVILEISKKFSALTKSDYWMNIIIKRSCLNEKESIY